MKTLHVGGFNPIRRYRTLEDALAHAEDDDTIVIHKNLKGSWRIQKSIIIKGNGKTITVPKGQGGLICERDLEIYDLKIVTEPRSNAIVTDKHLSLERVTIEVNGPVRAFYPLLYSDADRKNKIDIQDSHIMGLSTGVNTQVQLIDSHITSYYAGQPIHLTTRDDMSVIAGHAEVSGGSLRSTILSGTARLTGVELKRYVDVEGEVTMHDVVLNAEEAYLPLQRKEPKNGPLQHQTHSKYVLSLLPESHLTIRKYTVPTDLEDFIGIFADKSTLQIEYVVQTEEKALHQINHSNVTFKDVTDENMWELNDSTSAYIQSKVNTNQQHESALAKLDALIGQDRVKEKIHSIMHTIQMNQKNPQSTFDFAYHMVFAGDPGTGKTMVAKLVAEALFEVGAIPENKLTEATSDQFVKGYVGQTGENTRKILDSALGGVLFIDEAYELTDKGDQNSFNSEVISVLIRYMEEHRKELVVIAAGYEEEMRQFLASNQGMSRRFQWVPFDNYTAQQMSDIFEVIRSSYQDVYEQPQLQQIIMPLFEKLTALHQSLPDARGHITNGGNGGLVRNTYQSIIQHKNTRVMTTNTEDVITLDDIKKGFKDQMEEALQQKGVSQ